jgi:hypothetical protein
MLSVSVAETGTSVVVPDNDVARLMYYLHCVTMGLGLDILEDDLVDYKNYRRLSRARTELVFKSALLFSPDELIDKLIFQDDDQIVTKTSANQFCRVSVACDIVSLQRDVVIAGKMQNATSVMFFRLSWLEKNYTQPLLNLLIDSMSSTAISSSPPSSVPVAVTQSSNSHQCICDRCGSQYFQGTRYRCKVCDDFDLCRACYVADNAHDFSHGFMQINHLGSSPIELAPRAPAPVRAAKVHHLPAPAAALPKRDPPPYSSATTSSTVSPVFYKNMTVSELKEYLQRHDVVCGDIREKETLSCRAWETHCDWMTVPELNTFLTQNNISTSDCRDITSRRQKAKDVFRTGAKTPCFQEYDVVILTKLSRMELNGERATVVKGDCGGGRVEVLLDGSDTRIKVKFENLMVVQTTNGRHA